MADEYGTAEMTVQIVATQRVEVAQPDPVTADEAMEGMGGGPGAEPAPDAGTQQVTPGAPGPEPGGGAGMPSAVPDVARVANEQARLLNEWAELSETRKQVAKAARGDDSALQVLFEDERTRRYALDPKQGLAEIDETIKGIKTELGFPAADDAQIDKVAERHAEAIGRMAIQQGAGMASSLFGIPGIGQIAGAASVGGIMGIAGAVLATASLGAGMVHDWGKESVNLDEQLAIAQARDAGVNIELLKLESESLTTAKYGDNIGIDAVQLYGRANQLQARLGISREEALDRVLAEQAALKGYGIDASALAAAPGIEHAGAGLAAGIAEGARSAGLGDMAGPLAQQTAAMAGMLSHQLMRPVTGAELGGMADFALDAGQFGGPAALAQSAELYGTLSAMARAGGGDRKTAFLARVFGSLPGPKDPQSFMDWMAPGNLHPGSPGMMAVVAALKAEYGDNWRMAAVEYGFAPDTLRARALEWGGDPDAIPEVSDAEGFQRAADEMESSSTGRAAKDTAESQAQKQVSGITQFAEARARIAHGWNVNISDAGMQGAVGLTMMEEMLRLIPDSWVPDAAAPVPVSVSDAQANAAFRALAFMDSIKAIGGHGGGGQQTPAVEIQAGNNQTKTVVEMRFYDANAGQSSGPPAAGVNRGGGYRPPVQQQ